MQRPRHRLPVVRVGHVEGAFERTLDLHREPALDRGPYEAERDEEQEDRRCDRHRDEPADKTGAQVRTQDPLPPLDDEFHDVAAEQEHDQEDEDDVQVDEEEEDDVL